MKTLKCNFCDDTTEFEDYEEITSYVCEDCWYKSAFQRLKKV